jgi:hypothetical protein
MQLLEIVQRFCERTGLPQPGQVFGSTDAQVLQIKGLCDEIIEDLQDRGGANGWQALTQEISFVTVNGEDQGVLSTIVANALGGVNDDGFMSIRNDTIWNRTTRLPLFGPLAPREWQAQKANPATGPWQQYRISSGHLVFNPIGVAGQTCVFEISSRNMVVSITGVPRPTFNADTDSLLLDYRLLLSGIRWKWKCEKGLDYSEDFAHYERLVANAASHDGTKKTLSMNGPEGTMYPRPGIFISPGSWPIH